MEFNSEGLLKPTTSAGLLDEISAYKAQYSYEPSSIPGSVSKGSEINIQFIANIRDSNGNLVYPAIYQRYQNQLDQMRINKKNQQRNGQ